MTIVKDRWEAEFQVLGDRTEKCNSFTFSEAVRSYLNLRNIAKSFSNLDECQELEPPWHTRS